MGYFVVSVDTVPGGVSAANDPDRFKPFEVKPLEYESEEIDLDSFDVNLDDWGIDFDEPTREDSDESDTEMPVDAYYPLPHPYPVTHAHIKQGFTQYCHCYGVSTLQARMYFRKRLATVFGVEVNSLDRFPNETMLDRLARLDLLDKLYALIQAELACQD